ncbi:GNAT family N-acetyltransferase [Actinocatenispora sera]|uniref:GNAT family N-acetyltransferase n=1 Tax=Actinocatenispora sera TaxID=390989 RepID=UPI0033E81917
MTAAGTPPSGRFPAQVNIVGLGLHLREWGDADLPAMVELFDDPTVAAWTPLASPFDLSAAREYLDQTRIRRAEGRSIQLAITTDRVDPLGEILLFATGPDGRGPGGQYAELAYAIGPTHRRQGLTSRAVRLMTEYAYHTLAMQQVLLRIDPANTASNGVARAAGFLLTGTPPDTDGASGPLLTWRHVRGRGYPGMTGR